MRKGADVEGNGQPLSLVAGHNTNGAFREHGKSRRLRQRNCKGRFRGARPDTSPRKKSRGYGLSERLYRSRGPPSVAGGEKWKVGAGQVYFQRTDVGKKKLPESTGDHVG